MSVTLSMVSLFISCVALFVVVLVTRIFYRAVHKMETQSGHWASPLLSPGEDLISKLRPYVAEHGMELPTTGFILYVSSPSQLVASRHSLCSVCEHWAYEYRILIDRNLRNWLQSNSAALLNDVVTVTDMLRGDLRLPAVAVMFVRDGRLMDCAADIYYPHALQSRFMLSAAR